MEWLDKRVNVFAILIEILNLIKQTVELNKRTDRRTVNRLLYSHRTWSVNWVSMSIVCVWVCVLHSSHYVGIEEKH